MAATLALSVALGWAGSALAGPFEDGLAAAQRGDYAQAAAHYRDAANQGDAKAEFILGVMYAHGQGVPVDNAEAATWYRKAADKGVAAAEFSLSELYQNGQGVPQDAEQAALWRRKSTEHDPISTLVTADTPPIAIATPSTGSRFGAPGVSQVSFREEMDAVFGAGRWRETGGYRSMERENALRAAGALTVPIGHVSRHSLGTPEAPGAYDIVVNGLSPVEAAVYLQRSGTRFAKLFPEGSHGTQGAHLHVEPLRRPISTLSVTAQR